MGLLLQLIFSLQLGWLPVAGRIDPKVEMVRHTNILTLDSIITNHSTTAVIIFLLLIVGLPLRRIWSRLIIPIAFANHPRRAWLSLWLPRFHTIIVLLAAALVALYFSPNWEALKSVLEHMILPVFTLSLALVGVFVRLTRSNMIETLQEDYVSSARARGVPERKIVYYHSLRNTFIPILTLIGLQVAILFAGAVLTETTFSWPGMGLMLREGIALRDYPLVQGGVTVFAVMISVTTLLMDILYAFVDPRIRY